MAKAKEALPVQIALAYTLSHPFPVWALVGPHTVQQMDELAAGAAMRLTPAEMAWLEDGEGA
jgi:aryl-alcohol dehydrogenase-like predicted oxidoreductase